LERSVPPRVDNAALSPVDLIRVDLSRFEMSRVDLSQIEAWRSPLL
jgi:hypothetical protein